MNHDQLQIIINLATKANDDLRQAASLGTTLNGVEFHSLDSDEQEALVPKLVSLVDMARDSLNYLLEFAGGVQ